MPPGEPRAWTWILREAGAGPDHSARLHFREHSPGRLVATLGRVEVPGFVPHRHQDADGEPVLTCVDEAHASAYAANLAGRHRSNLWIYSMIQARGATLALECGNGGASASERAEQTRLLHRLATREPGLTLLEWKIASSDTGVLLKVFAEGHTAGELLAYLAGDEGQTGSRFT